jgi:hypothetical protein
MNILPKKKDGKNDLRHSNCGWKKLKNSPFISHGTSKNLNLLLPQKSLLRWRGHRLLTKTVPAIKFEVKFANITLLRVATSNFSWESVFFSLSVPLFNPGKWAETSVAFTEIFTRFILLSLQFAAPVVVDITLPAVPATRTHLISHPDQSYLE